MNKPEGEEVRLAVRQLESRATGTGSCRTTCWSGAAPERSQLMGSCPEEMASVPEAADLGLGCGNPQAIATFVLLDLGSGAGFDCFLAARQVAENGRIIGVDVTLGKCLPRLAVALK